MRLPDEWRGPYPDRRDAWIGVYWDRSPRALFVYICIVPCFPIRLTWWL